MKTSHYIGLFAVVYAVVLLGQLPAEYLRWVAPRQIQVKQLSGRWWDGSAQGVTLQGYPLGTLRWQFKPASLLRLAPRLQWEVAPTPSAHMTGEVALSLAGAVSLDNVQLTAQASWVFQQIPQVKSLPLSAVQGMIAMQIKHLTYADGQCQALTGTANWQEGKSNVFGQTLVFSNPNAVLSCHDGGIIFAVTENNSIGNFQGNLVIRPDFNYSWKGVLQGNPDFIAQTESFIRWSDKGQIYLTQVGHL